VSSSVPTRLLDGLEAAVAGVRSDPAASSSVLRLVRAIGRIDDLADDVRVAVDRASEARGAHLVTAAEALLAVAGEPRSPDAAGVALVVEPDQATGLAVALCLRDAGYRVVSVRDAASAVAAVDRYDVAVLVLDIFLPDRDGRDVVLELSGTGIPIIVLSPQSTGTRLARAECVALGAAAFLLRDEVAERLPDEVAQVRGRSEAESSLAPRSRFVSSFEERSAEDPEEVLVLLAFPNVYSIADKAGPEVADGALRDFVDRLADEFGPGMVAGRWTADQIVLRVPADEETVARRLQRAIDAFPGDAPEDEASHALVRSVTGSVVSAPLGVPLEERVQEAGDVRLGLSTRGTRVASGDAGDPARPRAVLVEDDPVTAHLVVHKLQHSGFDVVTFDHGDRAAEALENDLDFDVAIFDINLPGQDGFQLIRKLRSLETVRRRPILILSGLESDEDLVRGLEMGADDYVLKPFSPVELTARVRRLISAGRRSARDP
jgi:DNA-binding response OmpR family regulator